MEAYIDTIKMVVLAIPVILAIWQALKARNYKKALTLMVDWTAHRAQDIKKRTKSDPLPELVNAQEKTGTRKTIKKIVENRKRDRLKNRGFEVGVDINDKGKVAPNVKFKWDF